MKLVSIIIPVYNVEKYLIECLDSVLQQNFPSYEIICIDDASTDHSYEILMKYQSAYDNNIVVLRHENNRGLSAARNTGLAFAEGKYIWFLDSDDVMAQGAIQELYDCAEANKLDIIYFNYNILKEEKSGWKIINQNQKEGEYEGIYTGQEMFSGFAETCILKIEAWRQFFKRQFLIDNELTFYEGILHEDILFSFLCAMSAGRVKNISKSFYLYRQRKDSIKNSKKWKQRADSLFVVLNEVYIFWNNHSLAANTEKGIEFLFSHFYNNYKRYSSYICDKAQLEMGNSAEKYLYHLLYNPEGKYASLTYEKLEILRHASKVLVFGAGRVAAEVLEILGQNYIKPAAVIVSSIQANPTMLYGIPVKSVEDFIEEKNAVVVIAVGTKTADEVERNLWKAGLKKTIRINRIAEKEGAGMASFNTEQVMQEMRQDLYAKYRKEEQQNGISAYCRKMLDSLEQENQIVIFGAGRSGKIILDLLLSHNIQTVQCFCDNSMKGTLAGYDIIAPQEAADRYPDACFVITPNSYENEIMRQLAHMGISVDRMWLFMTAYLK